MLEVGAVVVPRREQNDGGILDVLRGHAAQRFQEQVRIVVDGADRLVGEELREEPHHHLAVLQHVGDPGGRAQVVLEHVVLAVGVLHDVHARDVRVDAAGHFDADHLLAELRVAGDLLVRDLARPQDLLVMVDVAQEPVERGHALAHSLREPVPLRARNHMRNDIERDEALGARGFPINGERDADAVEEEVRRVAVLGDARRGRFGEPFRERRVVLAHGPIAVEHLVVEGGVRHQRNIKQKKDSSRNCGKREAPTWRPSSPGPETASVSPRGA